MSELETVRLPCGADDFHHHFRDGDLAKSVMRVTSKQFARALAMPNLVPPVITCEQALAYKKRLLSSIDTPCDLLMTLYLNTQTTCADVEFAATHKEENIVGIKFYPAGATTNSDAGVRDLSPIFPVLKEMQRYELPLLIHGEAVGNHIDVFDREAEFLDSDFATIISYFPGLRIVVEHISTAKAVDLVSSLGGNVAATITAHHLLYNRNAIFDGGLRPHNYCLPILKSERDRRSLLEAATSGNPKFFLGTDSAPHDIQAKESCCAKAGCFTALNALELYAEAFSSIGRVHALPDFASKFGAKFYRLPQNSTKERILVKRPQTIPESIDFGSGAVVPFMAGKTLSWTLL